MKEAPGERGEAADPRSVISPSLARYPGGQIVNFGKESFHNGGLVGLVMPNDEINDRRHSSRSQLRC
jgi:hypothetical protein